MTRTRASAAWAFAITAIALFMVSLDNLVVTTALPVIRHDLGSSLQDLEWMVNAYTLTFAVLLLTGAALGDRFGRRRLFVLGVLSLSPRPGRAGRARALAGRSRRPFPSPSSPPRSRPSGVPSRLAPGEASVASPSRSARWS